MDSFMISTDERYLKILNVFFSERHYAAYAM